MDGGGEALHAMAWSAAARAIGGASTPTPARSSGGATHMVSIPFRSSGPLAGARAVAAATPEPTAPVEDQRGWPVEEEEEMGRDRRLFGPAPSEEEVTEAVTAIRQIFAPVTISRFFEDGSSSTSSKDVTVKSPAASGKMYRISPAVSQSENIEPKMELYNTMTIASQKVIDAFCSLQINPSIQRMVMSLSSDEAVWDAVMKNEAVKEQLKSFHRVDRIELEKADSGSNVIEIILNWILGLAKTKILEIFDKIWKIAKDVLNHQDKVNASFVEDAVSSSFMLSVVVFMVVVVLRLWSGK